MSNRKENLTAFSPTIAQLEKELLRTKYRRNYWSTIRSTLFTLIAVASLVLLAVMYLPVLRVSGSSMGDTLASGDIVVTMRTEDVHRGDLVVFSIGNGKLLIKRVVAEAGDEIDILEDGTVTVNGEALDEPYVMNKTRGEYDIDLPYVVPEGRVFVLGDNRSVSVDSRNSAIGCVAGEQIIGKAAFKIWPIEEAELLISINQKGEAEA